MLDRRGDVNLVEKILDLLDTNLEHIKTSIDELKQTNQKLMILLVILMSSIAGIDVSKTLIHSLIGTEQKGQIQADPNQGEITQND